MKKGWTVIIQIEEKTCSVIHLKKEQSHKENEEYFEFEWILKCAMKLNEPDDFTPSMKIVNYNWDTRTSPEIRKNVLEGLMPFIEPNVMYERILNKPMQKMSLNSDVVRFLRPGALIVFKGAEKVFQSTEGDEAGQIFKFLQILCELSEDSQSKKILEEQYSQMVKGGAGLAEQLKGFFNSDLFNDDMRFITLLKCLSSDMYFPAYLKLRNSFFSVFPFKDMKGTGRLEITFHLLSASSSQYHLMSDPLATISHKKREQNANSQPGDYFEFEWDLTLMLTSYEKKTLDTSVKIVDYKFNEQSSPDLKIDTVAAWSPFLADHLKGNVNPILAASKKSTIPRSKKKFIEGKKDFDM